MDALGRPSEHGLISFDNAKEHFPMRAMVDDTKMSQSYSRPVKIVSLQSLTLLADIWEASQLILSLTETLTYIRGGEAQPVSQYDA